MREWGILHLCLEHELEEYAATTREWTRPTPIITAPTFGFAFIVGVPIRRRAFFQPRGQKLQVQFHRQITHAARGVCRKRTNSNRRAAGNIECLIRSVTRISVPVDNKCGGLSVEKAKAWREENFPCIPPP